MVATQARISVSSSSGWSAIGHGGAGSASVGGGSPEMRNDAYEAMSSAVPDERPASEWWAVFGTVTAAFDGFGCPFCGCTAWGCGAGFGGNEDAGKCFCLYFSCTLESSWITSR